MKKFYVTSQFVRDDENSVEVLVRGAHIYNRKDINAPLVTLCCEDATKVFYLLKEVGIPVDDIAVLNENTLIVASSDVTLTDSKYGVMFGYYPQINTLILTEGEYIPKHEKNNN